MGKLGIEETGILLCVGGIIQLSIRQHKCQYAKVDSSFSQR